VTTAPRAALSTALAFRPQGPRGALDGGSFSTALGGAVSPCRADSLLTSTESGATSTSLMPRLPAARRCPPLEGGLCGQALTTAGFHDRASPARESGGPSRPLGGVALAAPPLRAHRDGNYSHRLARLLGPPNDPSPVSQSRSWPTETRQFEATDAGPTAAVPRPYSRCPLLHCVDECAVATYWGFFSVPPMTTNAQFLKPAAILARTGRLMVVGIPRRTAPMRAKAQELHPIRSWWISTGP